MPVIKKEVDWVCDLCGECMSEKDAKDDNWLLFREEKVICYSCLEDINEILEDQYDF